MDTPVHSPLRKVTTFLATLLALLLTAVGFYSPAQAAEGTPITITDISFTSTTVADGQQTDVRLAWSVDLETATPPVSFTIPLDALSKAYLSSSA